MVIIRRFLPSGNNDRNDSTLLSVGRGFFPGNGKTIFRFRVQVLPSSGMASQRAFMREVRRIASLNNVPSGKALRFQGNGHSKFSIKRGVIGNVVICNMTQRNRTPFPFSSV